MKTDSNVAVEFKHVSKIYYLTENESGGLFKKKKVKEFYAIKDVSFQIFKGQVVGILGTNGSGKSTMALLLSEIAYPNEGEIFVNGEQALVAINTGLNRQLTGIENIKLKAAMLGLSRKKLDEVIEGVKEFSELGEFINQPVKKYSSGMKSRLGFSINLYLDPDIMIIDEALSVGDKTFSKKCMDRMNELKESGKTIIFISHSLPQVQRFCDTVIWLEGGHLREMGPTEIVSAHYSDYVESLSTMTKAQKKAALEGKFKNRIGGGKKKSGTKKKGSKKKSHVASETENMAESDKVTAEMVSATDQNDKAVEQE